MSAHQLSEPLWHRAVTPSPCLVQQCHLDLSFDCLFLGLYPGLAVQVGVCSSLPLSHQPLGS